MESDKSDQPKPTTDDENEIAAEPEVTDVPVAAEPEADSEDDSEKTEDKTDKAVDDIMKKDGDEVLKAQDEAAEKAVVMKQSRMERFKNWWAAWWAEPRKKWGTIVGVLALLVVLLAVPVTGANILGVVLKRNTTVQVVDSKTGAPVSGATVTVGGAKAQTEANGKATLRVHAGSKKLVVAKKYYGGYSHDVLVKAFGGGAVVKAPVVALGRQIQVKVVDKVSGKVLSGVTLAASGANAKTSKAGTADLVLPSGAATASVSVSLSGYNAQKFDIDAAGNLTKNTLALTPAGKLYFLSNLSGKIDVVKTNLDGTDRQTVLAGTGGEDRYSTSLLASRDWKYLALLSKRSGNNASVYLIDTTNGDKLTTIDEGDADFSLVGWSGDRFVYQVTRHSVQQWQPNRIVLKSFDPTSGQTLVLDQTQGSGSDGNNYAAQQFGSPYLINDQVVYIKSWQASYYNGAALLSGKSAELDTIGGDGSGHRTVKTFAPSSPTNYISADARLYEPDGLSILFDNTAYVYEDGKVSTTDTVNSTNFYNDPYPTYLLSPSSNSTFWADQRDGKNTLFVGDKDAKNQKQIASLSEYTTYGWYSDNYLLVSKNSSELYIMPTSGGTPLKITDYYKPAINYQGYGGGYGGL